MVENKLGAGGTNEMQKPFREVLRAAADWK